MQAVPRNRKDERASDDFEAGLVRTGGRRRGGGILDRRTIIITPAPSVTSDR